MPTTITHHRHQPKRTSEDSPVPPPLLLPPLLLQPPPLLLLLAAIRLVSPPRLPNSVCVLLVVPGCPRPITVVLKPPRAFSTRGRPTTGVLLSLLHMFFNRGDAMCLRVKSVFKCLQGSRGRGYNGGVP